jgi:radical SAM superfamily enzyme YgiQ (UPF0313 family)
MKAGIIDIYLPGDKKEYNGGYGTSFDVGESLLARSLGWIRTRNEYLPLVDYGYISAVLKQLGHEVTRIGQDRLLDERFDFYIFHPTLVRHGFETQCIRKLKASTDAPVFAVGPFAAKTPDVFENLVDFVVLGEAEVFLQELKGPADLRALVDAGETRIKAEFVKDLDSLPFPDWSIYPYRRFAMYPILKGKPMGLVQGSRSCPYLCNYCPYIVHEKSYRIRKPERVLDEIEHNLQVYGFKSIFFRDPVFTVNRRWVRALCEGILARGIKIEWACETRTDRLDEDLLDLMYDAGLRALKVGVETSEHEHLEKQKRKPPGKAQQEAIVRYCEGKGIRVVAFFILGLPDDTEKTMQATIDYAIDLGSSFANFTLCTPIPGTEFYREVEDRIFDHQYDHYDNFHMVYEPNRIAPELAKKYQEKALLKYYFRYGFVKKQIRNLLAS